METPRYMENRAGQIKDMAIFDFFTMNNKNGSQRPLFIETEWAVELGFKLNSVTTLKKGTAFEETYCWFADEKFIILPTIQYE